MLIHTHTITMGLEREQGFKIGGFRRRKGNLEAGFRGRKLMEK